ncbi:BhlA/UviB family holin-like peptide [Clostridium baratii]|uniref:BhlA/UviB family holin-like peptide n=1 Tax=Clostridium baratii TaxID=1561 RepID=UPI003BB19065
MEKLFDLVASQGIWTLLSFILIYYILKEQEKRDIKQNSRELKYQELIADLTSKFDLLHSDIQDLKSKLVDQTKN